MTGASDDLRLALVVLGVQDIVRNSGALEHARQSLRDVDAHGSHQHRELQLVQSLRLLENRVVLLATRLVDEVLPIVANNRAVRRNHRYTELVDLVEFRFLSLGSASHAGKLFVETEVVLDRDRGERLRLAFHLHPFLRFHCLV